MLNLFLFVFIIPALKVSWFLLIFWAHASMCILNVESSLLCYGFLYTGMILRFLLLPGIGINEGYTDGARKVSRQRSIYTKNRTKPYTTISYI
ncbi:hypothetical protein ACQKWADRAFT_258758 [Trichoderma austrokoningii]